MWDIIALSLIIVIMVFVLKGIFYKSAKLVEFYFKYIIGYFVIAMNSVILLPLFMWNGKNVKNTNILARASVIISKLINVKWHLRNIETITEEKAAVLLINHQSVMDLLCLNILWQYWGKATCVSKKELMYYFPFGLAFYLMDIIFIDRKNPKDAVKILQMKAKKFFQNKTKIVIFPEGKRSRNYTKLLPFKKGAFNMAIENQVPIIPIVISRYYFINNKKHIFNDGHVIVQCLEPVSTEGLTVDDVPDLIDRIHSDMEKVFKEISEELLSTLPSDYPLETLS